MLKVLQVFGGLDCGGAQSMLMNVYDNLDYSKIQFDFVKHSETDNFYGAKIQKMGGQIYECPRYKVYNHFAYKRWWKKFFKSHPEYKVVHSHVRSTASIILKIAKKFGLITISHSHSTSNGKGIKALIKKFLQRNIVKYSDNCFACSKNSGEWLFGKEIVNSNKFKVVPNAIDTDNFAFDKRARNDIREELGIQDNFVIGHVGRFSGMKNHAFMLDLLPAILKEKENSIILFVGDGELKKQIEDLVRDKGLEKNVKFLGLRSDVPKVLSAFDCFLFPSVWEGLPVAVIEAQANGLPVIMSDVITDEVKITNLVTKISLEDSKEKWVTEIVNSARDIDNKRKDEIAKSGYEIQSSSKTLQEIYLSLVGEKY